MLLFDELERSFSIGLTFAVSLFAPPQSNLRFIAMVIQFIAVLISALKYGYMRGYADANKMYLVRDRPIDSTIPRIVERPTEPLY